MYENAINLKFPLELISSLNEVFWSLWSKEMKEVAFSKIEEKISKIKIPKELE